MDSSLPCPPAFDVVQPVTGYEYSIGGGTTWVSITLPSTTSVTFPNLTNTTEYTIQLRAVSAAGSGTHISVRAQTAPVPVAPTESRAPRRRPPRGV